MGRFKKGISGNLQRGKDLSWARIGYWFDKVKEEWEQLTPNQRVGYSVELMKLLTNKAKVLPSDPTDSVTNVNESMELLKQFENKRGSDGQPPIAIPPGDGTGQV